MFRLWVSLVLIGCVQHAAAMDYLGMFNASNTAGVNIAGTIAVNAAIKKQAGDAASSRQGQASDALHARAKQALTYTPDPLVSKRVKQKFTTAVQKADPAKAGHIAAVMASNNVLVDFDRDMAPYGLRSNNVADAMSAYWITMWMIAHQKAAPTRKRVAAVRSQVATNLLDNAMLAKASPRQRQEVAEGLVYETMFALGQRADAERRRDRARQRELADATQANLLEKGIDLQGLRLTSIGFAGD